MKNNYFLTTAIDYVNSVPHIGTAYEKIGADVLARWNRSLGKNVLFQMGNDEHSVNVKKSALSKNLDPKTYCDEMKPEFEKAWKSLSISYDQFIQTSDEKHHQAVKKFFQKVYDANYIYEGDYEGLYCESCEAFYTEKDLTDDGKCPQHLKAPKEIKEKNYFFKLSSFEDALLKHIEEHPEFILPEIRRNEIINVIKGGLKDVSVSRSGFDWGIPLPINEKHVVYVWFDALINYLSLIDFENEGEKFQTNWPADLHVIGKDITRFHCVIWPAMLMAAGLELPKTVFGHGFVYLKGEKMSKSLGNVLTPLDITEKFGADALRYYLLRTSSFGDDGNFTWDDFIHRYNSDLANGLGNTASRTAGMIFKYFEGSLELSSDLQEEDIKLLDQYSLLLQLCTQYLDPVQKGDILFHRALEQIWEWLSSVDRYIDQQEPWSLAKQENLDRLKQVLSTVSYCLYLSGALIEAFLPNTVIKLYQTFSWEKSTKSISDRSWKDISRVEVQKKRDALFPRIDLSTDEEKN